MDKQQNSRELLKEFKIKQRDFERKLEFNNNSDPLSLWYNHIIWIWDNSDIVDNDQKLLINLIEKCIEKFASDSKYKNDIRFYTIFYKYTQITSDPDDVYDSIYSLSLFDKLAKFYISWSWVLVNLNRDEKALEILNLGIEKKAEPLYLLIQTKDELVNKIKEKKSFCSNEQLTNQQLNEQPTSTQSINEINRTRLSINRKSLIDRKSIEPTSTTINSFVSRLSTKSLNRSNTPKENLFIKSTINKQGFEILEEDSEENRLSTENELNQQNKINKLKPLIIHHSNESKQQTNNHQQTTSIHNEKEEEEEEYKIVIYEKLKSNQRFYADVKRIYKDTDTEYSFEEIRMRKLKKLNKLKQNKSAKESIANIELLKEIEMLKAKLKENEKREKEKESLQNQVDILKKQIDMIISQNLTTQSSMKRCLDEIDYVTIEQDRTKKLKLRQQEANRQRQALRRKDTDKEELTIVRDMWNSINGTFVSQNSPANYNNYTELNNREQQQINTNHQRKEFSIFKDATQTQFIKTNDFSYYPQMLSTTAAQDCTIALPHDPSEFKAKLVSTPACDKRRKF